LGDAATERITEDFPFSGWLAMAGVVFGVQITGLCMCGQSDRVTVTRPDAE
jgi:hypothetical protein